MNAIRIRKRIDSETLHLPELRPLIGKAVEIVVLEEDTKSTIRPGSGDWDTAMRAVAELEAYDFGAYETLQAVDLKHARDRQP